MVKMEEKLKKEVVDLYLFANLMYNDTLESIGKKKKPSDLKKNGF